MKKKYLMVIMIVFLSINMVGCKNKDKIYDKIYDDALHLVEQKEYLSAIEKLKGINDDEEYEDLINYLKAKELYDKGHAEDYENIKDSYEIMDKISIENYQGDLKNDIIAFKETVGVDIKYFQAKELYEKRSGDRYENIKEAFEIMDTVNEDNYEGKFKSLIIEFKGTISRTWENSKFIDELGLVMVEILEFNNKMTNAINNNLSDLLLDNITEKLGLYSLKGEFPFAETKFINVHNKVKNMKPPTNKKLISLHSDMVILTADMVSAYNSLIADSLDNNSSRASENLIKNIKKIDDLSRKLHELKNEILVFGLD